jgi:hypothetical protein
VVSICQSSPKTRIAKRQADLRWWGSGRAHLLAKQSEDGGPVNSYVFGG